MAFDKKQFKELIEETLKEIDMYSESAVNLLLGTAAQESKFGTYLRQLNGGPALGVFQMEPATHDDIWENWLKYREEITYNLLFEFGYGQDYDQLVYDLKYAIIMTRLHYRRVKEPLPDSNDKIGLAKYFKKHYNTHKGKATTVAFIKNYNKYVE